MSHNGKSILVSCLVASLGVSAFADIPNGHFESRPNSVWYSDSPSIAAGWATIALGQCDVDCSTLRLLAEDCGDLARAWNSGFCFCSSGNGYATLTFDAKSSPAGNAFIYFSCGSSPAVTKWLPATGWTTFKVSVSVSNVDTTNTHVQFNECAIEEGGELCVDNVSVCWTSTDQTTRNFADEPKDPQCACVPAGGEEQLIPAQGSPGEECDVALLCPCPIGSCSPSPATLDPSQMEDRIVKVLSNWGACDNCEEDVWPVESHDGQVDVNDLLVIIDALRPQ